MAANFIPGLKFCPVFLAWMSAITVGTSLPSAAIQWGSPRGRHCASAVGAAMVTGFAAAIGTEPGLDAVGTANGISTLALKKGVSMTDFVAGAGYTAYGAL